MFRIFLYLTVSFGCLQTHAANESNDIGNYDGDAKEQNFTAKDLRDRIEVTGEIYITDGEGKLLKKGHEFRSWKFGGSGDLLSNWSYVQNGMKEIALRHRWTISEDTKITVHIEQFESMKKKPSDTKMIPQKLIREETIEVKDFTPVTWVSYSDQKERVLVRLTPHLLDSQKLVEVGDFPLSLHEVVIYDSQGNFWSRVHGAEGRYVAITTHFGLVAISFSPFKGAKEIGRALGNEITIEAGSDNKIYFLASQPILPLSSPAKIYGLVSKDSKTERFTSVHVQVTDKESTFLKNLK